ncbi:hypothetical protein Y032_0639g982 [Ancylostoma ceylanicum]|uniref:Uncharacterized protein n=1 Tax=Ancylostoma ceylanicum TaxID=53326 RepID=A0A016WKK0_9BILA|nr:hypothetical protein Y032_0639g982 [Ancylostoma ceylanicum]
MRYAQAAIGWRFGRHAIPREIGQNRSRVHGLLLKMNARGVTTAAFVMFARKILAILRSLIRVMRQFYEKRAHRTRICEPVSGTTEIQLQFPRNSKVVKQKERGEQQKAEKRYSLYSDFIVLAGCLQ